MLIFECKMSFKAGNFDVAVIGAGHAGIEAALAAAISGATPRFLPFLSIGWEICHATLPSEVPQRDTLSEKSTHSAGKWAARPIKSDSKQNA